MNRASLPDERLTPAPTRAPHRAAILLTATLGVLAVGACSNISAVTTERVAQSEVAVQQTQQTIGQSESGAVELQQAREDLDAAKQALARGRGEEAERRAMQAQLHAELAVVKVQSAEARRAADEVLASLEMLRQESDRASPPTQ